MSQASKQNQVVHVDDSVYIIMLSFLFIAVIKEVLIVYYVIHYHMMDIDLTDKADVGLKTTMYAISAIFEDIPQMFMHGNWTLVNLHVLIFDNIQICKKRQYFYFEKYLVKTDIFIFVNAGFMVNAAILYLKPCIGLVQT